MVYCHYDFFYICDGSVGTATNSRSLNKKRMCRRGKTVIYYVIFYVWVLVCSIFFLTDVLILNDGVGRNTSKYGVLSEYLRLLA
jgi:hypothetical protein